MLPYHNSILSVTADSHHDNQNRQQHRRQQPLPQQYKNYPEQTHITLRMDTHKMENNRSTIIEHVVNRVRQLPDLSEVKNTTTSSPSNMAFDMNSTQLICQQLSNMSAVLYPASVSYPASGAELLP